MKEFDKTFITSPFGKAYLNENAGHSNQNLFVLPNRVKEKLFAKKFEGKKENRLVFSGKMNTGLLQRRFLYENFVYHPKVTLSTR